MATRNYKGHLKMDKIYNIDQTTVISTFGNRAQDIKAACIANPPTVNPENYGNTEELGFISIVKRIAPEINVLHKTMNPEYIKLYRKHMVDKKNYEFTDFDRKFGDLYMNGYRWDLKEASMPIKASRKGGMPSYVAGSIPVSSVMFFHQDDGLSLYLCVSKDWSRMFIVSADNVWEYIKNNPKYADSIANVTKLAAQNKPIDDGGFITINELPQYCYVEII